MVSLLCSSVMVGYTVVLLSCGFIVVGWWCAGDVVVWCWLSCGQFSSSHIALMSVIVVVVFLWLPHHGQ